MAEPFDTDPKSSFGAEAARARDDVKHRYEDLRRGAAAGDRPASGPASEHSAGASYDPRATASAFREGATQAADEAKGLAASIAEQARARLNEIVEQQKAVGAAKIAGVARAAHSAAGDLDETNPQLGRLVRTAADSVDRMADDLRSRDIGQVVATLAEFGRRQPVAFFGGAVVAGFLVSRFFKSDAPLVDVSAFDHDRT